MIVTFENSFFDVFTVPNDVSNHIKEFFEAEKGVRVSTDNPVEMIKAINNNCTQEYEINDDKISLVQVRAAVPPTPVVATINEVLKSNIINGLDKDIMPEYQRLIVEMTRVSNLIKNRVDINLFIESVRKTFSIYGVNNIMSDSVSLHIHTKPITCSVESGDFDLGRIIYSIPFSIFSEGTGEIMVHSDTNDGDLVLPHAYSENENGYYRVCFGSAMPAILDAISKVDIEVLATLLINFMKSGVDEKDDLGKNVFNFPEA